ncbi:MAG: hypothetical protein HRT52_01270 [Colwellia sp.]|nr:hypothetical protein [Colwellia sp.]
MKNIMLTALVISLILSFSVNAAEQMKVENNAEISIQYNTTQLKQELNAQLKEAIKNSISKVRVTQYVENSSLIVKSDVSQNKNTRQKSEED